jgi:hypothetical protein
MVTVELGSAIVVCIKLVEGKGILSAEHVNKICFPYNTRISYPALLTKFFQKIAVPWTYTIALKNFAIELRVNQL